MVSDPSLNISFDGNIWRAPIEIFGVSVSSLETSEFCANETGAVQKMGMDIHGWPYLVGSDDTPSDVGMCFSTEPMVCIPGEFGIRHEDHFYMTEDGPKWFTEPSHSVEDPFGLAS